MKLADWLIDLYIDWMLFGIQQFLAADDYDALKNQEMATLEQTIAMQERVTANQYSFNWTFISPC